MAAVSMAVEAVSKVVAGVSTAAARGKVEARAAKAREAGKMVSFPRWRQWLPVPG
jgi:hypothetical protein